MGTHRAPFLCLFLDFIFSTCAGNVIGEADSNPSFLCEDRQDENSIQTSNGKQKINFEQIQDSCMWEGPNVQIRACATILNQTSVSKKYGSVLACLLCSVSNVFVCLCMFLCVLAEGMRGISSEQGGHTVIYSPLSKGVQMTLSALSSGCGWESCRSDLEVWMTFF